MTDSLRHGTIVMHARGHLLILWTLAAALSIAPVMTAAIPPLYDYYAHLARMHIWMNARDPILSEFYQVRWSLLPNLAMDLIVPWIARYVSLEAAGQLFIAGSLLLMLSGTGALHYVLHRRYSLWPLVASLCVYNWVLRFGFINYLFGIGLMLWAVAIWMALRDRPTAVRVAVGSALALGLYFSHFMALGLYAVVVLVHEGRGALVHRERPPQLYDALLAGAGQFVLPMLLFLLSSETVSLASRPIAYRLWPDKLFLIPASVLTGNAAADVPLLVAAAILLLVAVRRGWLRLDDSMRLPLLVAGALVIAAPFRVFGVSHIDTRLPIALIFLAIGSLVVIPDERRLQTLVGLVLVLLFVTRTAVIWADWRQSDRHIREYRAVFQTLPPGAVLLSAGPIVDVYRLVDRPGAHHPPVRHISALAILERPVLLPQLLLVPGHQAVIIRDTYRHLVAYSGGPRPIIARTRSELTEAILDLAHLLERTPHRFSRHYLLVHDTPGRLGPVPDGAVVVAEREKFYVLDISALVTKPDERALSGGGQSMEPGC